MTFSGFISLTKPAITTLACLSNNTTNNPTTPTKPLKISPLNRNPRKQNQPSVAEVERAIGSGIFRDHDYSDSETRGNKNVFDVVLSNTIGKTEGKTEKKLRETGEWINDQSERATRKTGKKILEIMFLWIAPAWLLLFLVVTGGVKLPPSFSALNDFIM